MYKQGLGDCFLLTLTGKGKPFHMLIDCGALASDHYDDKESIRSVVSDVFDTTGGRLDVVAATHEHWDHISGFSHAKDLFDEFEIDRVWVAWTEEAGNRAAAALKKEFKRKKAAVAMALARLPADQTGQLQLYRSAVAELFGFSDGLGAVEGDGRTAVAWDALLGCAKHHYCDPKKAPLPVRDIDGVRVYVLGPPEDPDFVRKKLSKKETYEEHGAGPSLFEGLLAALESGTADDDASQRAQPFDVRRRIPIEAARLDPFFREHYGFDDGGSDAWRRIDHDWLTVAGELALHLDSYTNNTCLALAVELGESGKVLLFPGDAQVGNWLSWGGLSWKVKDAGGASRTVTCDDLLARTVLYKVGHHGSHNATLREKGLEKMQSSDLVAMIPVHRKAAKDKHWKFPYPPLWERLKTKARGRVLLADAEGVEEIEEDALEHLSAREWKDFCGRTKFTDLYVEYTIPY